MSMELITDLNDPRIRPNKVDRIRSGSRQEFREKDKRSFDGDFYINPPERHMYLEPNGDGWEWVNGCAECNGKPRDWMTYVECDKHNVCRRCGCSRKDLTEAPWGGKSGWICKRCDKIEHEQEKIEALAAMPDDDDFDKWDYHGLYEIKCPYCDYKYPDSWECAGDDGAEHECPRCDSTFTVTAIHSMTFDCNRKVTT